MKALLGKTRTVLQEKEKREAELTEMRLAKFSVHTVLQVAASARGQSARVWCLVRDEGESVSGAIPAGSAVEGYQWQPEEVLRDWEARGSVVVGKRPASLDSVWEERRAESERRLKAVEAEKRELQAQLDESVAAFNTYKTRAQAALKKVSGDDKSERKRVANIEETELERLQTEVQALQEESQALRDELQTLELAKANSAIAARDAASRLADQAALLESLSKQLATAEERAKESAVAKEDETVRRLEAECLVSSLRTQLEMSSPPTQRLTDALPLSRETSADKDGRPSSTRLVLLDKTDQESREVTSLLRAENASLSSEQIELRRMLTLSSEQVALLKENIRELELRLVREVEFNSASNRVNAEYLMNVLKKFLLNDVPGERAKLVTVLCSMLHFRPEESRVIEEKWAVKRPTGIAGWFMGAPAKPSVSVEEELIDEEEEVIEEEDEEERTAAADN